MKYRVGSTPPEIIAPSSGPRLWQKMFRLGWLGAVQRVLNPAPCGQPRDIGKAAIKALENDPNLAARLGARIAKT